MPNIGLIYISRWLVMLSRHSFDLIRNSTVFFFTYSILQLSEITPISHQQWNVSRLQWLGLVMVSLFGAEWKSLRTWPEIRKSNDLWPMSEPCCGHFHSFCTPINAPHGVITPLEDVFWKSHWVSEAPWLGCAEELPWASECCPGPWHLKMPIFLCGFWEREGEGFLALSAGPQQMANWTSTMRPSGAILMLHMLHPAAMTSWRLFSHTPSQPSPWLHNPNCGEQTSALTNTKHTHSMKTLFKP